MRQEDLAELDEPDGGAEHLSLRPLRAVEEQPLATAANEQRGRRPPGRRHRAGGAEEDEVEVHGRKCRLARWQALMSLRRRPAIGRASSYGGRWTRRCTTRSGSSGSATRSPRRTATCTV